MKWEGGVKMQRVLFCLVALSLIGGAGYAGYKNGQVGIEEVFAICLMGLFSLFWGCFVIGRKVILTADEISIRLGKRVKKSIKYKDITEIEILMSPIRVKIRGENGDVHTIRFKQLSYLYTWLADLILKDYSLHERIANFSFDDSIGIRVEEEMRKKKSV